MPNSILQKRCVGLAGWLRQPSCLAEQSLTKLSTASAKEELHNAGEIALETDVRTRLRAKMRRALHPWSVLNRAIVVRLPARLNCARVPHVIRSIEVRTHVVQELPLTSGRFGVPKMGAQNLKVDSRPSCFEPPFLMPKSGRSTASSN